MAANANDEVSLQLFPLAYDRRTWIAYGALLLLLSWFYFGDLRFHLLDVHDQQTFTDNEAIDRDFAHFFSPAKAQPSGRPTAELGKWLAYLIGGNSPAFFHLFTVGLHAFASWLLVPLLVRSGVTRETSFLTSLLFFFNVAHFQAIHHISALDYPLALILATGAMLAYMHFVQWRTRTAALLFGSCLLLATGAHVASLVVLPFCFHWSYRQGLGLGYRLRWSLACALLGLAIVVIVLLITSEETTTWAAIRTRLDQGFPAALQSAGELYLWFVGRLVTTAHWLPLRPYELQSWELYAGAACLLGSLLILRVFPYPHWIVWSLISLVPFTLMTKGIILQHPAGTSRYLYFATIGSSLVLAWGLLRGGRLLGRWGNYATLLAILGLGTTSFVAFAEAEALSTYASARSYVANFDIETGTRLLRQSLAQSKDDVLRQEMYFRLVILLPVLGEAPLSLCQKAVREYPESFWLNATLAVFEQESPNLRQQGLRRMELVYQQASPILRDDLEFNLAAIYHNLAEGYAKKGDYLEAIRTFESALELSPDKVMSRLALSRVYIGVGRQLEQGSHKKKAGEAYRRSLQLNPQSEEAQQALRSLAGQATP
jgi:tetratricopeptide (TPR) repeat protein